MARQGIIDPSSARSVSAGGPFLVAFWSPETGKPCEPVENNVNVFPLVNASFEAFWHVAADPKMNPAYRPAHHHSCDLRKHPYLKVLWGTVRTATETASELVRWLAPVSPRRTT
jgi:hypothetical protein